MCHSHAHKNQSNYGSPKKRELDTVNENSREVFPARQAGRGDFPSFK